MRVLVVEDDEMIGHGLAQALQAAGWSVDWVRDGVLAQGALDQGGYTCALLDLGLPRCDGTEVLRRARAHGDETPVIRRRDGAAHSLIGNGTLQLDLTTRELLVDGSRECLSAREFALLHALLERPGAILSREQLETRIYGWGDEVSSNAVDVLIHGMRRKVGAATIRNVRGLGWRIATT